MGRASKEVHMLNILLWVGVVLAVGLAVLALGKRDTRYTQDAYMELEFRHA